MKEKSYLYQSKRLNSEVINNSHEIISWLSQFSNEKRNIAKLLLEQLKFISHEEFLKWLRAELEKLPPDEHYALYSVRKLKKKGLLFSTKNNIIDRKGKTLGSEDFIYSFISNITRSNSVQFFDHPTINDLKKKKLHNIVLIDDSIGSGDRVIKYIKSMLKHKSFKSWWTYGIIKIIILAFAQSYESKKKIIDEIPCSVFRKKNPLKYKIKFINTICYKKDFLEGRWGKYYNDILKLIDSQKNIQSEFRQGYGNMMSNIIFYHSVPNNIPGVLFDKKRWKPLFPGRSIPNWFIKLIDKIPSISENEIIKLLLLIKSGIKTTSSLAWRLERDSDFINNMLYKIKKLGFITDNIHISKTGKKLLSEESHKINLPFLDNSLYIPKFWCIDQATIQPPLIRNIIPYKKTNPNEVTTSNGGEVGQTSLERSDAWAISSPINVRSQMPSVSQLGSDIKGPLDSKEKWMGTWSVHHLFEQAANRLGIETAYDIQKYAYNLIQKGLPVIFSLKHLSNITNSDYKFLRETVNRNREVANYKMFAIKKRSGGLRFIHTVSKQLFKIQQFINSEILSRISPHPCSFAFHKNGGISRCASLHCGARWLFQYDLSNFFYDINESDVFNVFKKLGYRKLLSFELARLCTTIHLPITLKKYLLESNNNPISKVPPYQYKPFLGVLPQGAPTSPMLSNLASEYLDQLLSNYAIENGLIYTRYADDLTLSARIIPKNKNIGTIHKQIIKIIRKCGFMENLKKIRIAGPGSKKIVLGLLVDGDRPRISKEMYKRIDRHLYAAKKYGIENTAKHEGFESAFGFYNHLNGLIAFVKDVDKVRWNEFKERFLKLDYILN